MDLSPKRKAKIRNFRKTRLRMINMMVSSGKISKFKLGIISNFLTMLGCGKIKSGQGTFASFVTVMIWFCATMFFVKIQASIAYENIFWIIIICLSSFYAFVLTPIYTRNFTEDDHPSIVIDEFIGQLIALCMTYPFIRQYYHEETWLLTKIVMFAHMSLCFLLFRIFDIAKPSFIGWIDRNMKNPFGVLLDDIAAGVVAGAIGITLFLFYKNSIIQLHGF